ncbi:MAG: hypothetical protein DRP09_14545 [Candidatus Thorarchaeota archaeon]|nr:MAG: hypothetical protein DRP09_14545 [Candidatus Thorarchaeota archaeon]
MSINALRCDFCKEPILCSEETVKSDDSEGTIVACQYCMSKMKRRINNRDFTLDSINENAIQNLVNDLSKERTVILITHRLSSHAQVDRILMMSEGKCQDILSDNSDDSEVKVTEIMHRSKDCK